MNPRFKLLTSIIVISFFVYLYSLNPQHISIYLIKDRYITMPAVLLVFISFFLGMLFALLNFVLFDIKRIISEWKERRLLKKSIDAKRLYENAANEIYRGNIIRAKRLLKDSIKKDPCKIDAYLKLSEIYLKNNETIAAQDVLKNGFSLNPSNPEITFKLIDVCAAANDRNQAHNILNEYLEKEPSSLHALRKLRDMLMDGEKWNEATEPQKKIVALMKSGYLHGANNEQIENEVKLLSGIRYETAKTFYNEEKFGASMEQIEEILKIDHSFIPAHIIMGSVYYKQGKPTSSIKAWERAYRKYRHIALFMQIEDLYLKESLPHKIIRLYKRTIDFHPDDKILRLFLARLYLRLEMVDEAIRELEGLSMEGENSKYQNLLLADAYLRRNRFDKACAAFKNAVSAKDAAYPFVCQNCGSSFDEWSGRCADCGKWDTIDCKL